MKIVSILLGFYWILFLIVQMKMKPSNTPLPELKMIQLMDRLINGALYLNQYGQSMSIIATIWNDHAGVNTRKPQRERWVSKHSEEKLIW